MSAIDKFHNSESFRGSYYHKKFALKAAFEAERVLSFFEKECPHDLRPRNAIEAIKLWVKGERTLNMKEVRKLSLEAHAAARNVKSDAAKYAARAAGHAVATWHAPTHALATFLYAEKARCAKQVKR